MNINIRNILKLALADDKKSDVKKAVLKNAVENLVDDAIGNVIDRKKRGYVLGLGSVLATLGACSAPIDPNAKKATPATKSLNDYESQNISVELCDDDICIDDDDDPDPVGAPGVPPVSTAPVVGNPPVQTPAPQIPVPAPAPAPITPNPIQNPNPNPIQTPTPTPVDTTPPGIVMPVQTFTSIGPGLANVDASDMQNSADVQLMSDGKAIRVWGFTSSAGTAFNSDPNRLSPGPVIEAIEGQLMTIALRSQLPHTLHLHGLDVDQANDGAPITSGFVSQMDPLAPGTPPSSRILNPPGVWLGNPFEYQFVAPQAGTYLYHCHVDTVLHMEMGMAGTIIVRPPSGSKNELWEGGYLFKREYIWQLHTFDSTWHEAALGSGTSTMRYNPDYFMVNGRDGVDVLTDPTASIEGYEGEDIVIRLVNLGYQPAIVSLGDIPFDVVASDGRPLKQLYLDLFTEILVAPGERYDIMFKMPPTGITNASVQYLDIQGRNSLGAATPTITSL